MAWTVIDTMNWRGRMLWACFSSLLLRHHCAAFVLPAGSRTLQSVQGWIESGCVYYIVLRGLIVTSPITVLLFRNRGVYVYVCVSFVDRSFALMQNPPNEHT